MRARNREVNIFNMSLLDILCGALGAFCFLMLVLLPYWKPSGQTAEDFRKQYESAANELASIREKLKSMPGGADIEAKLNRLQNLLQRQQGEINDLQRRANEYKRQAQESDSQVSDLKMREPLLVSVRWSTSQHNVDVYVRARGKTATGKEMPMVDATKSQATFFQGDEFLDCPSGPCNDNWQSRDVPINLEYEIHYKFLSDGGNPQPAEIVDAYLMNRGIFIKLPRIKLPRQQTSALVGVFKATAPDSIQFVPEPEYKAQFDELNKKTPKPEEEKKGK
ncbi:hypothetical protein [uncultured Paludibaculum sp.]|uniref:hypothetical protein n=1 Tax=uncultured Paludibaculum sp. TaxID=1765020 RepID=UPI002AAAFABD|nr:hypothetical protein [uncultured Paludibaculum sp.]